jgi:hypothetical protein
MASMPVPLPRHRGGYGQTIEVAAGGGVDATRATKSIGRQRRNRHGARSVLAAARLLVSRRVLNEESKYAVQQYRSTNMPAFRLKKL